ncbi:MAG: glycerol-3-phosphate 1-O-acyltransferase PlsY [Alphaproteobacteria bacterium]
MTVYLIIISCILGYLLGSIPFGLVIVRLAGLGDIRKIGSGNIGATNVLRTGRKDLTALTLICDSGKAALAAFLAFKYFGSQEIGLLTGCLSVLGHNFPVWLKFKGGKGVATTIGVMLVTSFYSGASVCAIWLFMAFVFKKSSLSALTALFLAPFLGFYFAGANVAIFYAFLTILSFIRHHENIKRLLRGEESNIKINK